MSLPFIPLSDPKKSAVIADVKKLFPEWNEQNETIRNDAGRFDVRVLGDRVIQPATYNEETGEQLTEAIFEGVYRVDIVHPENWGCPVEFDTEVNPQNRDSHYV
jgi:hypothetical protein